MGKSNRWNFDFDTNKIRKDDEEEMNKTYNIVMEQEALIMKTEMMMQEHSLYSDSYKPLFIYEMNEEELKQFAVVLNQKLRHVKLAISKANLGQNKYKSENEQNSNINDSVVIHKGKKSILDKHVLDNKIFEKRVNLFSYDNFAKNKLEIMNVISKEYNELIQKEKTLPKIKESIEERNKLKESITKKKEEIDKLNSSFKNNFNNEHFKPTAARNTKLPMLKSNKISDNKEKLKPSLNMQNLASKYKSKDKMSVGEMFESYKSECQDYIHSLINPFTKLNKYIKKEGNLGSNIVNTLIELGNFKNLSSNQNTLNGVIQHNLLNSSITTNNGNEVENVLSNNVHNNNSKFKNFNNTKYSEDMMDFNNHGKS